MVKHVIVRDNIAISGSGITCWSPSVVHVTKTEHWLILVSRHLPGSSKHQLEPPSMFTSPGQATSTAPSSSSLLPQTPPVPPIQPHLAPSLRLRARTVLEDSRDACLGVVSRQFDGALSSAGLTKAGCWVCTAIEHDSEYYDRIRSSNSQ